MTDRITTGSNRLDEILNGGWLKNGINLVSGIPGSGKTILSQQTAFHNATSERPAVYVTSQYEPLDKIVRYGQSMKFFDPKAIDSGRVVFHDVGSQLRQSGWSGALEAVQGILKDVRPALIVIDGMRSTQRTSNGDAEYIEFLSSLLRHLTVAATTTLFNTRHRRSEVIDQPEAAIADAILTLDVQKVRERQTRVLEVLKLRGSDYRSGEHMYRITSSGIDVFPRLADPQIEMGYDLLPSQTGTGIEAVDKLLGGSGYWEGATTLVAGPTGVGKTLMGLHYLYRGGAAGEPGILATFQENKTQLSRIVSRFGWSIDDPNVTVMSRGIVDMNIDEWVYELISLVESTGAKRVVIDSLSDLGTAVELVRLREWMYSLNQRFTRAGVSLMLIVEVAQLFHLDRVSDNDISHFSDNVVLLQYVQEGAELVRAITILKTRAMQLQPMVYRYTITDEGFKLGDAIGFVR